MSRCRIEADVDYRSVLERKCDQLSSQLSRLLRSNIDVRVNRDYCSHMDRACRLWSQQAAERLQVAPILQIVWLASCTDCRHSG